MKSSDFEKPYRPGGEQHENRPLRLILFFLFCVLLYSLVTLVRNMS